MSLSFSIQGFASLPKEIVTSAASSFLLAFGYDFADQFAQIAKKIGVAETDAQSHTVSGLIMLVPAGLFKANNVFERAATSSGVAAILTGCFGNPKPWLLSHQNASSAHNLSVVAAAVLLLPPNAIPYTQDSSILSKVGADATTVLSYALSDDLSTYLRQSFRNPSVKILVSGAASSFLGRVLLANSPNSYSGLIGATLLQAEAEYLARFIYKGVSSGLTQETTAAGVSLFMSFLIVLNHPQRDRARTSMIAGLMMPLAFYALDFIRSNRSS